MFNTQVLTFFNHDWNDWIRAEKVLQIDVCLLCRLSRKCKNCGSSTNVISEQVISPYNLRCYKLNSVSNLSDTSVFQICCTSSTPPGNPNLPKLPKALTRPCKATDREHDVYKNAWDFYLSGRRGFRSTHQPPPPPFPPDLQFVSPGNHAAYIRRTNAEGFIPCSKSIDPPAPSSRGFREDRPASRGAARIRLLSVYWPAAGTKKNAIGFVR